MLKKYFNKYISIGASEALPIEISQRVRLLNVFSFFLIVTFSLIVGWAVFSKLLFPAMVSLGFLSLILLALYFNYTSNYATAKSLFFSIAAVALLLVQNSLDIDFTTTGYYFPLIIAFLILYDVKKEKLQFSITLLFTLACLVGCFALPGHIIYEYTFSESQYDISIILSYSVPFAIVFAMLFTLININAQSQEILIKARLEAESAYKAKSNFLSVMSHELRTPLNGIVGATNLLKYEQITPSQKSYLDILEHSSDQMLSLVNNILDFSKIEIGKINLDRNTFNLKKLLEKISKSFESKTTEKLAFKINVDNRLDKTIISDDLRLMQIVNNLLSNAFKFTKTGFVELNATLEKQERKELSISFFVKDTGLGIKEEQAHKIFESFEQADKSTTRNYGGTGLGLSISKQLVELFGSELTLESIYGQGSTFKFNINAELDETIVLEETKTENIEKLTGLNILVVEDNGVNMLILTTFLKKWDATFSKASNGIQALKAFNENKYDLILMDLEMPEMDGYTAIKEIRKFDTEIPVLAFTAALYDNMSNDLISRGFNDFVHKPFNPQDLFKKLSEYALVNEELFLN